MTIWLQLLIAGAYLYTAIDFAIRKEWPWAMVYTCYGVSVLGLIVAQPKA